MKELDPDLKALQGRNNTSQYARDLTMTDLTVLLVQEVRNLRTAMEKEIQAQKNTKNSLDNLTLTIEKLDKKNVILQKGIFWLTFALFLFAAIQILLTIFPHFS